MSDDIHNLLLEIDKKNRRYRFFQSACVFLILALLLVVLIGQSMTLDTVKQQQLEQKRVDEQTARQAKAQREDINRRLNCIVLFFSQSNYQDRSIENVEQCSLSINTPPAEFFTVPQASSQTTQPDKEVQQPAQQSTPAATAPPQPDRSLIDSIVGGSTNILELILGGGNDKNN